MTDRWSGRGARDPRSPRDDWDRRNPRDPGGSSSSRQRDRNLGRPSNDRRRDDGAWPDDQEGERDLRDWDGRRVPRGPARSDGRSRHDGHAGHSGQANHTHAERAGERSRLPSPRDDRRHHDRDYRVNGHADRRYYGEPYPDDARRPRRHRDHDRDRDEPPGASRHRREYDGDEGYGYDGRERYAERGGNYDERFGERYDERYDDGGGYGQEYDRYGRYDQSEQAARPDRGTRRDMPGRSGYGYDQPAEARRGYGQPGARTRPFEGDPPMVPLPPRAATSRTQDWRRATRRPSGRGMWITLSVLGALVAILGGGGAYAYIQYVAPGHAAEAFCGALKANNATAAYGQLAAVEQAQLTERQLSTGLQALTTIEGAVLTCAVSASGAGYAYQFGGATATVSAVITRARAGTLRGDFTLASEHGAWKISRFDTSLLGADPGALAAASGFCAALQGQDYPGAYGLLASGIGQKQQDFTQAAQTHDQIDGLVTACSPVSLGQLQSAAGSTLTLSITRAKLAARKGSMTLANATNGWQITALDTTLLGTDLGPLQVGTRFCADLASGSYADAYTLLSAREQALGSADQFAAQIAPPSPLVWDGCTPDLNTYKVAGTTASYTIALTLRDTANGITASASFVVSLVIENNAWRMDDLQKA